MKVRRRITTRSVAFGLGAGLLYAFGGAALLAGLAVTVVSCSPATDMGDAGVFIRVGPSAVLAGAGAMVLARQVGRRRHASTPLAQRRPLDGLRLFVGLAMIAVTAAVATWSFVGDAPWATTASVFYGPYYVSQVVPLRFWGRLFLEGSALVVVPTVATLFLSRRRITAPWLIVVAVLGALSAATLTYVDLGACQATSHGWALVFLDVALCLTLLLAAVDSFDALQTRDFWTASRAQE